MRLPPDIVSPFDEARPAVEIPPANVEVAVEVAKMAANEGVVVPARLPDEFVERTMLFPILGRAMVVPASNVNVPEVYESDASERRKDNESTESRVVASVQLVVTAISFAFAVMQVPAPTARAPALWARPAPSREE